MMCPSLHQPLDSRAVRWQQRSASAAGFPSWSRNRTIFSPKRVNGFGPSRSFSVGMVAYQKRRRTFCLVLSMVLTPGCLSGGELGDDARGVVAKRGEVEAGDAPVVDDAAAAD